jgi:hypothetical protein
MLVFRMQYHLPDILKYTDEPQKKLQRKASTADKNYISQLNSMNSLEHYSNYLKNNLSNLDVFKFRYI